MEDKKSPQVVIKVNDKEPQLNEVPEENNKENSRPEGKENEQEEERGEEDAQIIPWRAQLRKTNSKLSLID